MLTVMPARRTYDEGCAAAHALDLVGDRWALLVVRELLVGPKRFSDLRAGLPGISPSVLSQRLEDLESIGVLRQRDLPPPAASRVYELTAWGAELEPVLVELGRWGGRSPAMPFAAPSSVASMVVALRTMFDPAAAETVDLTVELRLDGRPFAARVAERRLELTPGAPDAPGAALDTDPDTLKLLAFAGLPLAEARRTGALRLEGNAALAERFFGLFAMPEPVEAGASR